MRTRSVLIVCLLALALPAAAADRFGATFVNSLPEEIVDITLTLATDGEPRRTSSRVSLQPEGNYRIGVQGAREPLRIIVDVATKRYDFPDCSALQGYDELNLEVVHADGKPRLRQFRDGGVVADVEGGELDYLSVYNLPNAVDKDDFVELATMDRIRELVAAKVAESIEELGEAKGVDIEAGPIWNNDHALQRCPEAAEEWNAEHPGEARWTGHWATTVPNVMSICNCVSGAADLAGTMFEDKHGDESILAFPVKYGNLTGVARVGMEGRGSDKIVKSFRFAAPSEGFEEALDGLLDEVRLDGYRSWTLRLEKASDDGSVEMNFSEGEDDKWDAQEKVVSAVTEARTGHALREAVCLLVDGDTYEKAASGAKELPPAPGVVLLVSPGTFEAVYFPDCTGMIR